MGKIILKIIAQIAAVFVFLFGWMFVSGLLSFSTPTANWQIPAAAGFFIGLFLALHYAFWRHKTVLKIGLGLAAFSLLFSGSVLFHRWWTVDRFEKLDSKVEWWRCKPFGDPAGYAEGS